MSDPIQITATIVLYKENVQTLKATVNSFLEIPFSKKLYLIDNSPKNNLEHVFKHPEIEFIFNNKNLGFGAAHNLVLEKLNSEYHLILNPDVTFKASIFKELILQLQQQKNVAMITPKVVYPNGENQVICRKNPTAKEMISRRIGLFKKNEYSEAKLSKSFNPEFIHGCFMLFKTAGFINLKGFDERYFLYLEDADICREIKKVGKEILYYPKVQITHIHRKGSAKNIKLLTHHISSARKYFKKWKN